MAAFNPDSRYAPRDMETYTRLFDEYRDVSEPNRLEATLDIDYYDGLQYSEVEKGILIERGQPIIPINRVRVAINGILGVMARARTDPRCWPRNPQDEDSADAGSMCLRFIEQSNRFDQQKVELFKDMLVPGTCAAFIGVKADRSVDIQQVRWEELFIDPRSRRLDAKDARYIGIAKWMYSADIAAKYKTKAEDLEEAVTNGIGGVIDVTFEDRPVEVGITGWIDRANKRLMVVEVYHREPSGWMRCIYYAGGKLEEDVSPYLDKKGRPCCPIEVRSAYIDRNNNRYGAVRDMRPIQDEINKRRSKLLNLLSSSQIQANDPAAIEVSPDVARIEAAKPDGVIPFGWIKVPTTDMAQGQMQLLGEAKSEMERFGPNPAILGRQGSDTSGRALLTRQQAGLVELAVLFDGFEDFEQRVYEQCWARAKQYWTEPMWVRVTDDFQAPQFLQVNEPVLDEMGQPVIDPRTGKPQVKNRPAELDLDISIDTTPETATLMQEQLKDLIDMVGSNPTYAQQVPFEIFIEMTPMPRKRQLLEKIKAHREQAEEMQAGIQHAQMKMEFDKMRSDIAVQMSKSELNVALAVKALFEGNAQIQRAGAEVNKVAHDALAFDEEPVAGDSGASGGGSDNAVGG